MEIGITIIYRKDGRRSNPEGQILVFGANDEGQLGFEDYFDRYIPTLLEINLNIKQIVCGEEYTIIYLKDGTVKGFGDNKYGNFGPNNSIGTHICLTDSEIQTISCGKQHTLFYKNNGDLIVCGDNQYSQLGLELDDDEDDDIPDFTTLLNDPGIQAISCKKNQTILYKLNRDILVFGANNFGQLGFGSSINMVCTPTILMNDPTILQINNTKINPLNWSQEKHTLLPWSFQLGIITLYKCLKQIYLKTNIKIPRFIMYEIIKFCV